MSTGTREHMTATLGGAFLLADYDETAEGNSPKADFESWYSDIGYVFVNLPDGTRMQLFYNAKTRLFVADVISADESRGNEFVRTTVPTP